MRINTREELAEYSIHSFGDLLKLTAMWLKGDKLSILLCYDMSYDFAGQVVKDWLPATMEHNESEYRRRGRRTRAIGRSLPEQRENVDLDRIRDLDADRKENP